MQKYDILLVIGTFPGGFMLLTITHSLTTKLIS